MDRLALAPNSAETRDGYLPSFLAMAGLFLVVFATAWGGIELSRVGSRVAAFWPANAAVLVVLLRTPQMQWPAYLVTALAANFAADLAIGDATLVGLGLSLTNTLEIMVAAYGTRALGPKASTSLLDTRLLLRLGTICGVFAPAIAALPAAAILTFGTGEPFGRDWLLWAVSDSVGMLVIVPFLLSVNTETLKRLAEPGQRAEALIALAGLVAANLMVFGQNRYPMLFLLVPAVLYPAFRLGFAGAATAIFVTAMSAAIFTALGKGAFMVFDASSLMVRAAAMQIYLVTLSLTAIAAAISLARRKATEEALADTEASLKAIMDNMTHGLITTDRDGGILTFSRPAEAMFGWHEDEIVGHGLDTLVGPRTEGFASLLAPADSKDGRNQRDILGRRKDGSTFPIDFTINEIEGKAGHGRFVATVRDVTRRQTAEARLREAQKMDAVGQLAGGIAHDFNNILGAMLGFAGFLQQDLPLGSAQRGFAQRIIDAGERAKGLVQQILAFSRSTDVERKPTDIAKVALDMRDLLRAALPGSTHFELAVEGAPLVGLVNAGQLSQILFNLCRNANEALDGKPGGIVLSIARAGLEDAPTSIAGGRVQSGEFDPRRRYAAIVVSDTGIGMESDVLRRIFDPFFTTKERGRGTGLGLSVVHGIVLSHGGICVVESRPGAGSRFSIYLPLAEEALAA